ncbi:AlpA family phage regulatory protein [Shewanella abyssi]|uniref:helix-turn-helix transcriptional regulator n=1 Tax=Shewanella abyssi TaxID=311789 RepID=UPI002010BA6B|nr:AlpA family phage regulatory protein [Shewanella abyssi]MCL1050813.1 AlpA family phage regulatory protein [Shewanella abyssi]
MSPHNTTQETKIEKDRFIREPECAHTSTLSRQRRWLLEKEGKFPKRIHIGDRTVVWRLSEVMAWIDEVSADRNSEV